MTHLILSMQESEVVLKRGLIILLFSLLVTPLHAASFDCNKATTETEKAICADPELSALDALMGYLWREYGEYVSKELLQEQREWLGKRNSCGADFKCLKSSYQTHFKSINPQLIYDNFQLLNLYDFSQKSFGQYYLAKGFGGSYNWSYYVISVNNSKSKILPWLIPKFDENFETCNINNIDGQDMPFQSSPELHGWIEEVEHGVISEPNKEINVYTKWVGHGDWSSEVNYRLIEGTFIPVQGKVDNCSDGQVKYSNINFESVK